MSESTPDAHAASRSKPFYVTTPIYYVNDRPHIGTAYSTIIADVFARYARLRGREARFLTGLDEHGLKLERRAKAEGMEPQEFVDRMAPPFKNAWQLLDCAHDDFIRTTEPRHEKLAQELWSQCERAGDIYLGEYEDWYCVGCEQFYPEGELVTPEGAAPTAPKHCPIHKTAVERVKEKSYFFRLSKYAEPLLALYEKHPDFVLPEGRFNEVKAFVKQGLRDLSISRTSFRWGVPVPGNAEHIMYVWFDALANYITALGGPPHRILATQPGDTTVQRAIPLYDTFWRDGESVHIVGKDILRFHAVFWPAFLMSAGVPLPKHIFAHGWLTVNGHKMSKSLGNFIPPEPLAEEFTSDVLRYYLLRDVSFGQDGDFSHANLVARYHGELGNGLGNLLNRAAAGFVTQYFDGRIPTCGPATAEDTALVEAAQTASNDARAAMDAFAPQRALDVIYTFVVVANKYVDTTAPWALKKAGDMTRLGTVVYNILESVRFIATMLAPVMPRKVDAIRAQLGLLPLSARVGDDAWPYEWGALRPGQLVQKGEPVFPKFEAPVLAAKSERLGAPLTAEGVLAAAEQEAAAQKAEAPKAATPKAPASTPSANAAAAPVAAAPSGSEQTGLITIDDLVKVDLRLGLIQAAERVPKSDKLLRLQVEIGEAAPRQILAGIGKTYEPEQLIGKRIVVVANLAPRKMMGLESHGMVLAASDDAGLSALFVDKDITAGVRVK